jgi:branched-chain amino acid transport system substrate-binding protein
MIKAGVLLPKSGVYPAIAISLMESLRLCLKEQGNSEKISFVSANVDFGGNEKEIYSKAENLLVTEGADLLIAYIDMKVMDILEPLLYATGKLLIVLNAGANLPEKKVPQGGVVYLTQQHSFAGALTGVLAGNTPASYATTFYDCGYAQGAAMVDTFSANGGRIVFNYVNNLRYDDSFHIDELIAFIDQQKGEHTKILCNFDELPASLLYKKLEGHQHADKISLYVSPRMLTKNALGKGGYKFDINGYTSWLPQIDTQENQAFKNALKKEPDTFHLSGWQAGLVLNEILTMPEDVQGPAEQIVKQLEGRTLHSPSSSMRLDPATNFFTADTIYKCTLRAWESDPAITQENVSAEQWTNFVQSRMDGPSSGWTNTYLCY